MDVETSAIAMGLVVGLLFSEAFGMTAGGMIVPGYFAVFLDDPLAIALTVGAALITFVLVRTVSRFAVVYGRRRIVITLLIGFLVGMLIRSAPALAGSANALPSGGEPLVIGFIIPGLIALWIDRQGLVETLSVLTASAVVVRLLLILTGMEVFE